MRYLLLLLLLALGCQTHRDSAGQLARIALVSDTHTSPNTKKGITYAEHLQQVIAQVNSANVDLVLIAGDLTDGGTVEQMGPFKKQIKGFKPPVLFVAGNHDVGAKVFAKGPAPVTMEKVVQFEKNLGPSFFATTRRGLRIIGVTGSLFGSGLPREKEMWTFLERELDHPKKIPTILFCHYPPFLKKADEPGGVYWNIEPEPRQRLLALIKRGGVRTMLTGHLHRPLVNRYEGILFVSTIPVSFGLPGGKQAPGWTLVTIPTEGEAQFQFKELSVVPTTTSP
jgi:3',5'-cyclic AMP phosphodiesterase CpdA